MNSSTKISGKDIIFLVDRKVKNISNQLIFIENEGNYGLLKTVNSPFLER